MPLRRLRLPKTGRLIAALTGLLLAGATTAAPSFASPAMNPASNVEQVCAAPSQPGQMSCTALRNTSMQPHTAGAPAGYGPADLRSAHNIPADTSRTPKTVAIVVNTKPSIRMSFSYSNSATAKRPACANSSRTRPQQPTSSPEGTAPAGGVCTPVTGLPASRTPS